MRQNLLNNIYNNNPPQFIVYASNGLILNLIGYLLYLALTESGFSPFISVSITYPMGILLSYHLHSRYTFKNEKERKDFKSIFKYTFIYVTGYFLNIIVLVFLHKIILLSHEFAQIIAIAIASIYFFMANKFWVFKRKYLTTRC